MQWTLTSLAELSDGAFDDVIDVRSPAEFAEDHIPGAINLPVLDDEERARVGTIYKQVSPFSARKLGAALVFRNASQHLEGSLADRPGDWRPLVYCWRGGQRSGTFAWMLREIGWQSRVIEGGYRTYRRLVNARLYDTPLPHRFVQLGGYTGTGKTDVLRRLQGLGMQVLDLEGLARHRGSLLGGRPGGQPSQKAFESALAMELMRFSVSKPVVVEAESSKIGARSLPPMVWHAMKAAPWIEVTAPLAARAHYLNRAYDDILSDGPRLSDALEPLRRFRGHGIVDGWQSLIASGDRLALTRALAVEHYDPAYDKSKRTMAPRILHSVAARDLTPAALDQVAQEVADLVQSSVI